MGTQGVPLVGTQRSNAMIETILYNVALAAVIIVCAVYCWAIVTYHEETMRDEEDLKK